MVYVTSIILYTGKLFVPGQAIWVMSNVADVGISQFVVCCLRSIIMQVSALFKLSGSW